MLPHNYDPDGSMGIQRDVLTEGRMELDSAVHHLRAMYVTLDSLADDPSIWAEDELAELRSIQKSVERLADEKESDRDETAARLDALLAEW